MIDLNDVTYRLVVMDEKGNQFNIKEYVQDLGWEEPDGEIATRISFTARNDTTSRGQLSSIIKSGCLVGIFAHAGSKDDEVARGYVVDWNPRLTNPLNNLTCKCYDGLYNLTESQDNKFYQEGTGTKTIITGILDDWEVPLGSYQGPDVSHAKITYKSESLADIITDTLDDAYRKGGTKCFLQERKGKAYILPYATNNDQYHVDVDSVISINHKISTDGLVTRVKIIGQADDDGQQATVATLNGKTSYGIRQKIVVQDKDDTEGKAQKDAQSILNDNGEPIETIEVQTPDIPFVHKGDVIHVQGAALSGYYYILGVSHDVDAGKMTLSLHVPFKEPEPQSTGQTTKKTYNVGDIVNFHGGTHYVSSYPGAKGYSVKAGQAKITKKNGSGKAHPWHLITTNWAATHVYGWVDDGTFD